MPDILQQLVDYGLLLLIVSVVALLIIPKLAAPSEKDVEDADEESCSKCEYDVRKLLQCPECGSSTPLARRQQLSRLREQWPTEAISVRLPDQDEKPIVILTTDDQLAGRLLSQHLTARGVSVELNKVPGVALTAYATAPASYRLTVWSGDVDHAKAIIDHLWPAEYRK